MNFPTLAAMFGFTRNLMKPVPLSRVLKSGNNQRRTPCLCSCCGAFPHWFWWAVAVIGSCTST